MRVLDNLATGHWGLLKRAVKDRRSSRRSPPTFATPKRWRARWTGSRSSSTKQRWARFRAASRIRSRATRSTSTERWWSSTARAAPACDGSSSRHRRPPTATPRPFPSSEDMRPSPMSPYAVSKLTCEHYMRVFASLYGLETLNLRYFNVFGPGQLPEGPYAAAIPRFVRAALTDEPDHHLRRRRADPRLLLHRQRRSRQPPRRRDHQQARRRSREHRRRPAHLAQRVAARDRACPRQEAGRAFRRPPRAGDVRDSLADISRAKELIGYEPVVKWEDGIGPTIDIHEGAPRTRSVLSRA